MKIGLDVGSTTLKCVVLDESENIVFSSYERHYSEIQPKVINLIKIISEKFKNCSSFCLTISGSAGMGLAEELGIPFVQEVYATRCAVRKLNSDADTVIELGGEDAKILFLTEYSLKSKFIENTEKVKNSALEVRMNGSCAGGTGAFIDQMATLMNISPDEMNELSKSYEKIYTIASRCGVFAKSDIQPLLNQGANKSDVSASIFAAVVNQTVAGLSQGREICGNVLYLGGPLSFLSELRRSFDSILKVQGVCPKNSLYYVAIGAALSQNLENYNLNDLISILLKIDNKSKYLSCPPLFASKDEYDEFIERHNKATISDNNFEAYNGNCYLGIDAGSTTVKAVLIDDNGAVLKSIYLSSSGNPVSIIKNFLQELYTEKPEIKISAATSTGYGEEIIKNAFNIDYGIVETIAHFTAAKSFLPNVDFIIDIGGQDIKCFKIHNGAIDNIFLNEACSSGCGSFLQTFAIALGHSVETFANLALFAKKPVDLGSRCTVFMNSSVKQAQKDGATVDNISAGLAISVVKNALYKVIRPSSMEELGKNIIVQGGTFLNDAVLRAFEKEIGINVVRPNISGLMGAYGAALYSKAHSKEKSNVLSQVDLTTFTHKAAAINCNGCTNHCRLTVNTFDKGRKFIGGNRCEKPLGLDNIKKDNNLYEFKQNLLNSYEPINGKRGKIGIPMALNLYELKPFWFTLFTDLNFEVIFSETSTKKMYLSGQHTIPSDTVCYPAKLLHGHIENLLSRGITSIFYPCLTYNIDEHLGDNHYNCPVVAYYPEVINANVSALNKINFYKPYFGIHKPEEFKKKFYDFIKEICPDIKYSEVKIAVSHAYDEYNSYMTKVQIKGKELLDRALSKNEQIVILSGRPYHIDPEVNHGIDKLITSFDTTVISEDVIVPMVTKFSTKVLNQWTYHSRLYAAAKFVADKNIKNLNLVQLVSFGCGVDAITTDEVRSILEAKGKIYTQIKIDEITNLGAVKIRLRSLFSTLDSNL